MPGSGNTAGPESRINQLKARMDRYLTGDESPTAAALADVAKAVHELADHVVGLHRRFEKVEQARPEWTVHGWEPPPGTDRDDPEQGA